LPESPFRHEQPDDSPGFLLWKLTSLWQARVAAALQPFGLTQTQYSILASVHWFEEHDGQPTQRHLVDHAKLDKMTLSKAIRKLEGAGLVSRHSSPHDARATEVGLTAAGRTTIAKAVVAVEDVDDDFFAALDQRGLSSWLGLSQRVVEHHTGAP
jgi:DNA-binding MarR family transcriptional regulator